MNQATENTALTIDAADTANVTGIVFNTVFTLNMNEQWAGILIGKDGAPDQHIILLPNEPAERLTHQDAIEWAAAQGGELPTRREQALLYANLKESFQERAYWSAETHAACADCAWYQNFNYGYQHDYDTKGGKLCVRAVCRQVI